MSERGDRMITNQVRLPNNFEGARASVGVSAFPLVFSEDTVRIILQPSSNNAGTIFVGHDDVTSAGAAALHELTATSAALNIPYDDRDNPIYIVASVPGLIYHVLALTRSSLVGGHVD